MSARRTMILGGRRALLAAISCAAALAPPALADSSPAPADAVAQLNQWRARVGVAPVAFDAANTEGCRLHSLYYAANGTLGHDEDSGRPGYTAQGAQAAASSALAYGSTAPGPYAWEWAIYHRIALLNPDLAASGYWSEHGISCMGILDTDATRASLLVASYPYPVDGQVDVPPTFTCNEGPNPCQSVAGDPGNVPIGQPLSLQFDGPLPPAAATVTAATLVADGQPPEPLTIEDARSPRAAYLDGGVAILPHLPLIPGASYGVRVTGMLGAVPFDRSWRFRTSGTRGPAEQSFARLYPTGEVAVISNSSAPMTFSVGGQPIRTVTPFAVGSAWRGEAQFSVPGGATTVCVVQAASRYALAGQTCQQLQTIRAGQNLRLHIVSVRRHGSRYLVRIQVPALLLGRRATLIARARRGTLRSQSVRLDQAVVTARLPAGLRPRLLRVTSPALRYGDRVVKVIAGTWRRR